VKAVEGRAHDRAVHGQIADAVVRREGLHAGQLVAPDDRDGERHGHVVVGDRGPEPQLCATGPADAAAVALCLGRGSRLHGRQQRFRLDAEDVAGGRAHLRGEGTCVARRVDRDDTVVPPLAQPEPAVLEGRGGGLPDQRRRTDAYRAALRTVDVVVVHPTVSDEGFQDSVIALFWPPVAVRPVMWLGARRSARRRAGRCRPATDDHCCRAAPATFRPVVRRR